MSDQPQEPHFFDAAIALSPQPDGSLAGATHPAWNNMVGPFGGITAATALNAVLRHPALLGEPVALTVNYAGPLNGPFTAVARPVRTNRSTQHWTVELRQSAKPDTAEGTDGADEVALTATVLTAVRRETWGSNDLPMPSLPAPSQVHRTPPRNTVEWLRRYDLRMVTGTIPSRWEGQAATDDPATSSLTQVWMRDDPPRPLDFCALTALADVFFPRIWLRRATFVPVGTVSMTVYFHVGAQALADTGTGYVLGQARGQGFAAGFFDQAAQLWNEAGTLLATTHQVVYYKH